MAVVTLHLLPSIIVVSTALTHASTSSLTFFVAFFPFITLVLSTVTHLQSNIAAVHIGAIVNFVMLVLQHNVGNQLLGYDLEYIGHGADKRIILKDKRVNNSVDENIMYSKPMAYKCLIAPLPFTLDMILHLMLIDLLEGWLPRTYQTP